MTRFLFALTLFFGVSVLSAQPVVEGGDSIKGGIDSLKKEQREKALKDIEKGLTYLAYLNYTDRTVDRMRAGIDDYKKFSGKVIRKVDIRIMKPFGTSLDQPDTYLPNKGEILANRFQISTYEWVVRKKLLFKPGDTLAPVLIADSEREIWDMDAFKDVKLVIGVPVADTTCVDITVLVRDRFSWSPYFIVAPDMINAGFQFTNLLGIPQKLVIFAGPIYRRDNPYIFSAVYTYNNVAATHINAEVNFIYEKLNKGVTAKLTRNFYSAFSKWAFSAQNAFYKQDAYIPSPYIAAINSKIEYNTPDAWVAHSIPFNPENEKSDLRRWILALRYKQQIYLHRDFLHNADYSLYYPNNWFVIGAVGFSNWDYYLNKDIYSLGEAEYFTKGLNFALLFGGQHQEDIGSRLYTGVRLNHGINIKKFAFWFSQLSYGGFLNGTNFEQLKLGFENRFFSTQRKLGKCIVRHFVNTNITFGFLLPPGQEIVINDANGIRGFYYNTIRGNRSYTFSYQLNFYPMRTLLTFSSCFFAFADWGISGKKLWNENQFVQAYGVGIRLRSMKLGIDYFQLTFAYYPNLNLPAQNPFNFIGELTNQNPPNRNDLFAPGIISP